MLNKRSLFSPRALSLVVALALPLVSQATDSEARWIWSAESVGESPWSPAGEVYFRKVIDLPENAKVEKATMLVGVDNSAEISINGEAAGNFAGWNPLASASVTALLKPGKNVLAVKASNPLPGPAGLLLSITIDFEGDQRSLKIGTDKSWTATSQSIPDWQTPTADPEGFQPAKAIAQNGELPWGLCLAPATGEKAFPSFKAEGADLTGLDDMLTRFHSACNMDIAGTYALAWLPSAMLWVGETSHVGESQTRMRVRNRLSNMRISVDGYVSCHQHEGLAHSEGWPFPLPNQHDGFGYYFSLVGVPYGLEFKLYPVKSVDDWKIENGESGKLDPDKGWTVELTKPNTTITSPQFSNDAFLAPFIRIKWDASQLPEGSKPFVQWTTTDAPEFDDARRMEFPKPSSSSQFPLQDFDIPIHEITKTQGKLTQLRIGFGNPTAGQVTILRVFSAVDSRHTVNNSNYLIASADYFDWTGDRAWLEANLSKLRLATKFMISEFQVRDARLLRTPWIGHDGRSGLEYTKDGKKLIHKGVGIGGNYWDLIPFGGDDVQATIYLYSALERMAGLERFVSTNKLAEAPAKELDAKSLRSLADAVRKKFQETFWNLQTKRFAPKDDQGKFRDYGFTFVNNEAMYYGLASKQQALDILSWISGERTVKGDTSQGKDIYHFRFGPRATTKRNIEYYAYVWTNPEDLEFGDQVQDGGAVLGFAYHDLMARIRYLGAGNAWARLREMLSWYQDVKNAGGARAYYAVAGRGSLQGGGTAGGLGIDEEFYESVLVPAVILDGFIGFKVHANGFSLDPRMPGELKNLAVSNVAYRDLLLDIEGTQDSIKFSVREGRVNDALRVRLPEGSWNAEIFAEKDGPGKTVAIPSGPEGFELPSGKLDSLVITRVPKPQGPTP